MDLLIPDNWLREYLKTKATPKELQKYLSLSGPTVDRINGTGKDITYEIEVTTNRPDAMSIYGIAREAATILSRHGIKAELSELKTKAKQKLSNKVGYLDLKIDKGLAPRSAAILLKNVSIKESPKFIQERLVKVGERPINNVVDISNYLMHELGQPVHTFDYDKITGHKMTMRQSKEGEDITTLDGKSYKLPEGGIVIEDGSGNLIDMPGIMGGLNTAIDKNTKNVLLFVQTYNSSLIRKMAMQLNKWSNAARLYEKGLDPELVEITTRRGIDLFVEHAGATPEKEILDLYFTPPKLNKIVLEKAYVDKVLGIQIDKQEIVKILTALQFKAKWANNNIEVIPPSFRAHDIEIKEDVIEEIARVYSYQNIPGKLMAGELPALIEEDTFEFESKLKRILVGLGASEIYTLSLVSKVDAGEDALKLSNPLGGDTEYLRTSLVPSLLKALVENKSWEKPLHLFEIANVYIPHTGKKVELPEERFMLAGIFKGYNYREAKGVLEVLLEKLNINEFDTSEVIKAGEEEGIWVYQFYLEELREKSKPYATFTPIPQFPAQIEDITLEMQPEVKVGEVMETMQQSEANISKIELVDIYKNAHTFRIWFQNPHKTLNNEEVAEIRTKMLDKVVNKFNLRLA